MIVCILLLDVHFFTVALFSNSILAKCNTTRAILLELPTFAVFSDNFFEKCNTIRLIRLTTTGLWIADAFTLESIFRPPLTFRITPIFVHPLPFHITPNNLAHEGN